MTRGERAASVVPPATPSVDDRRAAALGWVLRVGVALCFIGHGAFGLRQKIGWLPLFAAVGIGADRARHLMPLIGAADVGVGLIALGAPRAALLVYAVAWTLWTAALRPIAGLPGWEFVERAGNYGVPLTLLLLSAMPLFARARGAEPPSTTSRPDAGRWQTWLTVALTPSRPRSLTAAQNARLRWTLTATTALLLVGHAALTLGGKSEIIAHAALLAPAHATGAAHAAGVLELAFAALVLWRPTPALAIGIAGWKLATEALFLAAGAPGWEVVERAGSYAAPLALAVLLWPARARATSDDVEPAATPDRVTAPAAPARAAHAPPRPATGVA